MSANPIETTYRAKADVLHDAHNQWAKRPADERFETLEELSTAVDAFEKTAMSWNAKASDLEAVVDGERLLIDFDGTINLDPTHWAFSQLCQRVGAPPSYLRELPADLAAINLNHGLKSVGFEQAGKDPGVAMILANTEGESSIMCAATSTSYGRIWNSSMVELCRRMTAKAGGKKFSNPKDWSGRPSGLYASDRDAFIFMVDGGSIVDGGTPRSQLNRGFFLSNSIVGAATLNVSTFYFNYVCGNHFVWDAQEIRTYKIRHNSRAPEKFAEEAASTVERFMSHSAADEEAKLRRAVAYALPAKLDDCVAFAIENGGLTQMQARLAIRNAKVEEGQCATLWDLAQGITATARTYEHIDTRVALETLAGKLLEKVIG
jgi:Domain of unknown function (DUF932)